MNRKDRRTAKAEARRQAPCLELRPAAFPWTRLPARRSGGRMARP